MNRNRSNRNVANRLKSLSESFSSPAASKQN